MHDAALGRLVLGNRIRGRREALGLRQADLAARADVPAAHLAAIEDGGADISLDDLDRIARACGTLLVDLLAGVAPFGASPASEDGPARRDDAVVSSPVPRSAFLAELSDALAGSLHLARSAAHLAHLVVPRLADGCLVHVVDDNTLLQVATVADGGSVREGRTAHVADELPSALGRVMRTGAPSVTDSSSGVSGGAFLAPGDDGPLPWLARTRPASTIALPLSARGEAFGTLTLLSLERDTAYDDESLELAREVARRASVALDNARLYQERSRVARVLQDSLLPPELPRIRGVELAACHRPARQDSDISGDFYDVFQTGPCTWSIVMGDVCGKGPHAAVLTGLARHTIRAAAMQQESPSQVLGVLNDAIIQRGVDRFCTVAYARVECGEGGARVQLSTGGHPSPLLLRPDGTTEAVRTPGMLLGAFEEPDLDDLAFELGPGESLVLYTDGVTEARSGTGEYGQSRLASVLSASRGHDADTIAARVIEDVLSYLGGGAHDDIAVLVIRVPA